MSGEWGTPPPQQWPKVGREAAKKQIKNKLKGLTSD